MYDIAMQGNVDSASVIEYIIEVIQDHTTRRNQCISTKGKVHSLWKFESEYAGPKYQKGRGKSDKEESIDERVEYGNPMF